MTLDSSAQYFSQEKSSQDDDPYAQASRKDISQAHSCQPSALPNFQGLIGHGSRPEVCCLSVSFRDISQHLIDLLQAPLPPGGAGLKYLGQDQASFLSPGRLQQRRIRTLEVDDQQAREDRFDDSEEKEMLNGHDRKRHLQGIGKIQRPPIGPFGQ